jgi:nicotinate-nucleotide--dimethylbenzimidazole phosphoribosyltransferase
MEDRWSDGKPRAETAHVSRPTPTERRAHAKAAAATRQRLDELVKPPGSLGAVEDLVVRWAEIAGVPPPPSLRAGVLVFAADHGHVKHATSSYNAEVSALVSEVAARGETAIGVLARHGAHSLVVADVGLQFPTPPGVRDLKVAKGSADMLAGPALSEPQLDAAIEAGTALAAEMANSGVDCLALGEIGMGNTMTSAALASALTGAPPGATVGRGAGIDDAGLERKRSLVATALARHGSPRDPHEALLAVGGLELASLVGAMTEGARRGLPVILDGYAVGVAALAAARLDPAVADALIASHCSAEPGHVLALRELGLAPVLDLGMRLGEASGAALALPILAAAGALYAGMATFEEAGIQHRS